MKRQALEDIPESTLQKMALFPLHWPAAVQWWSELCSEGLIKCHCLLLGQKNSKNSQCCLYMILWCLFRHFTLASADWLRCKHWWCLIRQSQGAFGMRLHGLCPATATAWDILCRESKMRAVAGHRGILFRVFNLLPLEMIDPFDIIIPGASQYLVLKMNQ